MGSDHTVCPVTGYHTARVKIGEIRSVFDTEKRHFVDEDRPSADSMMKDERWPTQCACGYYFCSCGQSDCVIDAYQVFTEHLWRRVDTGEEVTLRDAPVGALWYADWLPHVTSAHDSQGNTVGVSWHPGPDGRILSCKTPGGNWIIDARATNCTMPMDNEHHCWVRHGTPPDITVDKNGNTCAAGAGSIQAGDWHGFLRNGELVT